MPFVPRSDLKSNTFDYENLPLVTPNGFREYDARWLFGKEINLLGVQALGLGLGTYLHEIGVKPRSSPATITAPIRCRSNRR